MSIDVVHRFQVEGSKLVDKFRVVWSKMRFVPTRVCMSSACSVVWWLGYTTSCMDEHCSDSRSRRRMCE